tara:strand:+ start:366 stop:1112 length:747 start_codon:yes stop_codon:yes gene_type:complete
MKWKKIKDVYFSSMIDIYDIPKYCNVRSSDSKYKVLPLITTSKVYKKINICSKKCMVLIRLVLTGCPPFFFYLFHKDENCLYTLYTIPISNIYEKYKQFIFNTHTHTIHCCRCLFKNFDQKIYIPIIRIGMNALNDYIDYPRLTTYTRHHTKLFGIAIRRNPRELLLNEYIIHDSKEECNSYKYISMDVKGSQLSIPEYKLPTRAQSLILYFSPNNILKFSNRYTYPILEEYIPKDVVNIIQEYLFDL